MFRFFWILFLAAAAGLSAPAAQVVKNSDCLECHSDKTLSKTNAAGKAISLFVDEARFKASRHSTNLCAACHSDLKPTHPDDNAPAKPVGLRRLPRAADRVLRHKRPRAGGPGGQDRGGRVQGLSRHPRRDLAALAQLAVALFAPGHHRAGSATRRRPSRSRPACTGRRWRRGGRNAPTCSDCHAEHSIEGVEERGPR